MGGIDIELIQSSCDLFRDSFNVRQINKTSWCLRLICWCCCILAASYEAVRNIHFLHFLQLDNTFLAFNIIQLFICIIGRKTNKQTKKQIPDSNTGQSTLVTMFSYSDSNSRKILKMYYNNQ